MMATAMLMVKLRRRAAGMVESNRLRLEKLEINPVLVKADVIWSERSKAEPFHSKVILLLLLFGWCSEFLPCYGRMRSEAKYLLIILIN